jgi:hypothetical protein
MIVADVSDMVVVAAAVVAPVEVAQMGPFDALRLLWRMMVADVSDMVVVAAPVVAPVPEVAAPVEVAAVALVEVAVALVEVAALRINSRRRAGQRLWRHGGMTDKMHAAVLMRVKLHCEIEIWLKVQLNVIW